MRVSGVMAYDISDDAVRRRVCRKVRGFSSGYQKSFFEMRGSLFEWVELLNEVLPMLEESDRFMLSRLPRNHIIWQLGVGPVSPASDILVIN